MTYKKLHLYVESFDLNETVDIFSSFVEGLRKYKAEKFNFNHYSEDPKRVTIRFNLGDGNAETEAIEIARGLKDDGKILHFDLPVEANPPEYVVTAHMLASKCAVELSKHIEFFEEKKDRPVRFIMYFLRLLFKRLGYPFYCTWDLVRDYEENPQSHSKVDKLAESCENFFTSYSPEFENADFIERFIHLLLNCTLMQNLYKSPKLFLNQQEEVNKIIT